MKQTWIIVFCFVWLSSLLHGQNSMDSRENKTNSGNNQKKTNLVGIVLDELSSNPLEFATITLYSKADSTLKNGGITNESGFFSIPLDTGFYFAKIEFIAYKTQIIDSIEIVSNKPSIDLGAISLQLQSTLLTEISVESQKKSVSIMLNKRVYNVEKDLIAKGGNLMDILGNLPSVIIGMEGNIYFRGNGLVRILVDGKPSALINSDNIQGLRQISANMIDYIEIISSPSAKYDAEGMAGIINVVLKKSEAYGLRGSYELSAGYPKNFGLGVNMNYRKNKLNWFTNISWNDRKTPGNGQLSQQFFPQIPDFLPLTSTMQRVHNRGGIARNFSFGADYFFNSKSILTTSFNYQNNDIDNDANLVYEDLFTDVEGIFLVTERKEKEDGKMTNLEYAVMYEKLFSEKNHQLTVDIRFQNKEEDKNSNFVENYFNRDNVPIDTALFEQITHNEELNQRWNGKIDYIRPFGKGKIELGVQSSYREVGNTYTVWQVINDNNVIDTDFTNEFKYRENIQAGYINLNQQYEKFSWKLGLRTEYSAITTQLLTTNTGTNREYFNLFPSAAITRKLPQQNVLQINYSRRIYRPRFWDLNPFLSLTDRRNIYKGNQEIIPEFTNIVEFGHIKYWENASLSSIIYYRNTNNVIKRIQRLTPDDPYKTITQTENLNIKRNVGIEFTYNVNTKKWWSLTGDFNFFHSLSEGTYNFLGQDIFLSGQSFSMTTKVAARVSCWQLFQNQLNANFQAPRMTTQGIAKSLYYFDYAISIDFLEKKGTLTLGVNDIFNSRRRRATSSDVSFSTFEELQGQNRTFLLTFSYRLNQQKKNTSAIEDLKKEGEEVVF